MSFSNQNRERYAMMIVRTLYQILLAPKADSEEARRPERILNILLSGTIGLSLVAFLLTLFQYTVLGMVDVALSLAITFGATCVFGIFLWLSRLGLRLVATYLFMAVFLLLSTYPIFIAGILLPQGILLYGLIIVMSGVLLGSRIAFWMAGIMAAILLILVHLGEVQVLHFDFSWAAVAGNYKDAITFGVTFVVIALVSWLSNREIQHSLERAQASEKELLRERNSLEVKVRERTKALEKAQVEKMLDLQRFAEFGRLSSTLLHELANPLTSVSLNLEQLEGKNRSKLVSHAREGIAHMEQYVEAARRQLRNQSEIKLFDIATEIERVIGLLKPRAVAQHVVIKFERVEDQHLKGDSVRFNHIISNLLSNAIDAYDESTTKKQKTISIIMRLEADTIVITVRDSGRGLTNEQLPHLFEPFYTTKQDGRGTGIGLTITKQAVEEVFQGTISASYSKRHGTEFVVRLPLQ